MQSASAPTLHPALLLPGTVVGPWRVVASAGRAMEWVEGVPLYDWARQSPPGVPQVLGLLAQLAGALAALHAHGGVHRDVKGDNVLVRRSDGRAMLTDFGTDHYPGVVPLTPPGAYPGTPAYRAPESGLFELQSLRDRSARYCAGPGDDLHALGVTACRLVTGKYPEFADPWKDEHDTWHLDAALPPPELLRIEPRLRDLILRMLSVSPAERGTAAQLAEALEQAVEPSPPQRTPPGACEGARRRTSRDHEDGSEGRRDHGARRSCDDPVHGGAPQPPRSGGDGRRHTARTAAGASGARCEGAMPSLATGCPQWWLLGAGVQGTRDVRNTRRADVQGHLLHPHLPALARAPTTPHLRPHEEVCSSVG